MSSTIDGLATGLLERVLVRLGLSSRPDPDLEGLQTLYTAWCRKVPFDNVRKLIHVSNRDPGPLPGDDAASLAARVLEQEHRFYPAALGWLAAGRVRVEGGRAAVDGAAPAGGALANPLPSDAAVPKR